MNIAIVGLGYVGTVTSACYADAGHQVIGVDVNLTKVSQVNAGVSPIVEPGLDSMISRVVSAGRLAATTDLSEAVRSSDYTIVCVGTPSTASGDVRLTELERVVYDIGDALSEKQDWHLVTITSTVPPGTVATRVAPILRERSRKVIGNEFGLAFSPEFLREASAVSDFQNPEKTVIGANDERSLGSARELLAPFASEVICTSVEVAEMVKFTDNAWHALKIVFANEIGRLSASAAIDSHRVMDIFKRDKKLNISEAYLTPGFAFGGSCLPKDLRSLTYRAKLNGVDVPVLDAILASNKRHVEAAFEWIQTFPGRRVALLGLAFKPGTDDVRESPLLDLAERLLGKGYAVSIHDRSIAPGRLIGANRDYALAALPHISELLRDTLEEAIADADIVLIGHRDQAYAAVAELAPVTASILDLTGIGRTQSPPTSYKGLLW